MLWVGGDGHCSASYAVNDCSTCEDDMELWTRGRQPHPENSNVSWATTVASTLNSQFVNEADIRDTPDDVSRKCIRFVKNNMLKYKILVIIGYSIPQDIAFINLSKELKKYSIRHIIFNTDDYIQFSLQNNYRPRVDNYFGKDAHQAWANVMVSQLRQLNII